MITDAENKAIPGPRLERGYLSPSAPNAERLVCGSCAHIAIAGHEVIHAADCKWAAAERERKSKIEDVDTK